MARTWAADDPKARLMARKRAALVAAATETFLDAGYSDASVNQIAAKAGVSIATLYRHFDTKDDLFTAVMKVACGRPDDASVAEVEPDWYALPPGEALLAAATEHLAHALSAEQIALYRVVARDAQRFPEVGRRYWREVIGRRDAVLVGYLDLWSDRAGWKIGDKSAVARAFAGLLKGELFDDVLLNERAPGPDEIAVQAGAATSHILRLLEIGAFADRT